MPAQNTAKSAVITIRLTPEHKAVLAQAAKITGLSVSSLLLVNGLTAARAVVGKSGEKRKEKKSSVTHSELNP